jgi:hypothetical protein
VTTAKLMVFKRVIAAAHSSHRGCDDVRGHPAGLRGIRRNGGGDRPHDGTALRSVAPRLGTPHIFAVTWDKLLKKLNFVGIAVS